MLLSILDALVWMRLSNIQYKNKNKKIGHMKKMISWLYKRKVRKTKSPMWTNYDLKPREPMLWQKSRGTASAASSMFFMWPDIRPQGPSCSDNRFYLFLCGCPTQAANTMKGILFTEALMQRVVSLKQSGCEVFSSQNGLKHCIKWPAFMLCEFTRSKSK